MGLGHTQATIIVPLYPTASGFGQGSVTISAAQSTTIGSAAGFVIDALPAAPGPTGAVTEAVLEQTYAAMAEGENLWTIAGTASGGQVSTAGVTANLADMQTHLLNLFGQVSGVAAGGAPFSIGTLSGQTMQISSATLATMDALLQAFYINNPAVQASISSLSPAILAQLQIPAYGRTPEENLHAFSALTSAQISLSPPSNSTLLLTSLMLGAVAVTPVGQIVAIIGVGNAINWATVGQQINNTIDKVLQGTDSSTTAQGLETTENSFQTEMTNSGATLSGEYASLSSDLQTLDSSLDPTNPTSTESEINSDQPTVSHNAPTPPPPGSIPIFSITATTISSTGSVFLNVEVQNLPDNGGPYTLTSSWGEKHGVAADQYGNGWAIFLTPPTSPGYCYSGTLTLTNYSSDTVASVSGCWTQAPPSIQGTTWYGPITWSGQGLVTRVTLYFGSQGTVGTYGQIGTMTWNPNTDLMYGWISGTSVNLALALPDGRFIPPGQPCSYTFTGSISGNTMSGTAQTIAGTVDGYGCGNNSGTFSFQPQ